MLKGKAAIITAFDPHLFKGGIETYSLQLVDLLKSRGIESDMYYDSVQEGDGVFHNSYLERLYRTGRKVFEHDGDYDFVVANSFYGLGYFPPGVITYNIFHLTHMAFAEEIKACVPREQYLEWKFLWGNLCESVSGFRRTSIAVSESVRDELNTYYGFDNVEVVPNCIDKKNIAKSDGISSRKKWGVPQDAFVGLYVGRWDVLKGCDIAEAIMQKRRDIYWLIVLGTGSSRADVPVAGNVRVVEQVEHERMREIYSSADFLLFPSRYEGFGYVITEAMACELPVITSPVGIAKTIYRDEPFRELLLPLSSTGLENVVESAIRKIDRIKTDGGWKDYIATEGRELVEERFDVEIWRAKMAAVLGV